MIKAKEGNKYSVLVIKQGNGFCLGLLPRGEYATVGSEVELETGLRGPVVMRDEYLDAEEVELIEKVAGIEAVPVRIRFTPSIIKWDEEGNPNE